jgi:hypothetical protein
MPCVYLPGPAPAVTVANNHDYLESKRILSEGRYEESAALNEDDYPEERNSAPAAAGTTRSTAQPAWNAARRAGRRWVSSRSADIW